MEKPGILKGINKIGSIPSEIGYGFVHLRQSFEQKRNVNIGEAQDFLSRLADSLPEKNHYFSLGEKPSVVRPVESGFHSACYKFESSKGRWVVKIGHSNSPMKTKFHPSTPEYAESYLRNLKIQTFIFGKELPNLIPEPQEVFYIKGRERATTIIVQPFIDHISLSDKKINFSSKERQQLRGELDVFKTLLEGMRDDYGIMSDFMRAGGKKGHLVIARKADGTHLVMLDNGVFDQNDDPTPALHFINKMLTERVVNSQKKLLK